jgi:hypothetical protein
MKAKFRGLGELTGDRSEYIVAIEEMGRGSVLRYQARVIGAGKIGKTGTLKNVKASAEGHFREKVEEWSE